MVRIKEFLNNMSGFKYAVLFFPLWILSNITLELATEMFLQGNGEAKFLYVICAIATIAGLCVLYKRAKNVGHGWQFWIFAFIPKVRLLYYIYLIFAKSPQEKEAEKQIKEVAPKYVAIKTIEQPTKDGESAFRYDLGGLSNEDQHKLWRSAKEFIKQNAHNIALALNSVLVLFLFSMIRDGINFRMLIAISIAVFNGVSCIKNLTSKEFIWISYTTNALLIVLSLEIERWAYMPWRLEETYRVIVSLVAILNMAYTYSRQRKIL